LDPTASPDVPAPDPESPGPPRIALPAEAASQKRGVLRTLGVAVLALLVKAKSLLLLVKSIKIAKLLLTMGSMFVMIWFEARQFGWMFGVGFVVLILIHELGHAGAIRRAGLDAGYPVFIPFLGAFISLKGQIRSPLVEADIALAGPIAGAAASTACVGLYFATHGRLWLALAHTGYFLNLFNMTPISPLDGGRAARVFSRQAWLAGLAILAALFVVTRAPQLLLIGFLAATHAFSRAGRQRAVDPALAAVEPEDRRNVAYTYFGLCVFLAIGTYLAGTVLAR
jgi:Zn-dependent protease